MSTVALCAVALYAVTVVASTSTAAADDADDTRLAQTDPSPCAGAPRAFFVDVDDDATAAPAIDCLVAHELVNGATHDRFAPAVALTRGQVASLLDRMIRETIGPLPDPATEVFTDTGGTHGPAVERLAAAGIVTGRTPDTYEPDTPVRRDQLASLLVHADAFVTDGDPDPDTPIAAHPFTDFTGSTHEAAIARAAELGLVTGTTTTTYEPARTATRAQTAMVLARLLQRWVTLPSIDADLGPSSGYQSRTSVLPASLRAEVERWTWEPGCPVAPADLRLVQLVFTDFSGVERWGLLLVHRDVVADVAGVFGEMHGRGFPMARIEPIETYRGDDDASMAANNTSAFNCRRVTGGTSFSQHAYGRAIDINPVQNPYVRSGMVLPPAGSAYLDRHDVRPGMLVRPGAVEAFDAIGWGWGGDFTSLKDYQHLSESGS